MKAADAGEGIEAIARPETPEKIYERKPARGNPAAPENGIFLWRTGLPADCGKGGA